MTTDQKDRLRVRHILDAVMHINEFLKDVPREEFKNNYEKRSAVIRQFEIIGEAAGKLSSDFINKHAEIDWSKVIGMRHKIIHDYFYVDVDIVWITATEDIENLEKLMEENLG